MFRTFTKLLQKDACTRTYKRTKFAFLRSHLALQCVLEVMLTFGLVHKYQVISLIPVTDMRVVRLYTHWEILT